MKYFSIAFIFFLTVFSTARAQEESCGIEEAWGGDTTAMHKFLRTCGTVDTLSFDEHNKPTKTKVHHQTIKMTLNTGKVVHADSIYFITEHMPEFPGGNNELYEYVAKSIHYPATAKTKKIQGRVYVQFIIERDGSVSRAKIVRGIGGGCDQESLRVIRAMPKWTPGKMHGIPVQVQYTLPVKFSM
jgi:TonB family protein